MNNTDNSSTSGRASSTVLRHRWFIQHYTDNGHGFPQRIRPRTPIIQDSRGQKYSVDAAGTIRRIL